MLTSTLRFVSLRRGPAVARNFCSTSAVRAAEVNSLGVVGAGQMVCNIEYTATLQV